jgi:hypothetical protein
MIERNTITFGAAVSRKEIEKALNEDSKTPCRSLNKLVVFGTATGFYCA